MYNIQSKKPSETYCCKYTPISIIMTLNVIIQAEYSWKRWKEIVNILLVLAVGFRVTRQ